MCPEFSASWVLIFLFVVKINFSFSLKTAVSLLFLPFVVCLLGPAFGCGRMDTGEKVVSIAEDELSSGSGLDTKHGVTVDDALSGMEDATVATLGDGVVEEDGTSGVTAGSGRSVTRDGAKSPSLKIFLLKGLIPVHANPA